MTLNSLFNNSFSLLSLKVTVSSMINLRNKKNSSVTDSTTTTSPTTKKLNEIPNDEL